MSPSLGSELRSIAETLARQAGDMALRGRKSGDVTATTKSSPTDMVTQYDLLRFVRTMQLSVKKVHHSRVLLASHGTSTPSTELLIFSSTFLCGQSL
jgi:hypothetical protein